MIKKIKERRNIEGELHSIVSTYIKTNFITFNYFIVCLISVHGLIPGVTITLGPFLGWGC